MRAAIRAAGAGLLACSLSLAAVSGTVTNRTSRKPQPNAVVTLYTIGQGGMSPLKTVRTDARGAFEMPDASPQGMGLLQAIHDGVTYNKMLQPGTPTTGLSLDVYDATPKPGAAKVTQHMVLIEPVGGELHVGESVTFTNTGNTTFNDASHGTLKFFIPAGVQGRGRLTVTAPAGMPVQRDLVETGEEGVYQTDFPVKPGDTRFDLSYVLPEPDPPLLTGKILHSGAAARLVAPQGVTLSAKNITQIGEEPQTHAKVYEVSGRDYSVAIEGSGRLNSAAPSGSGNGGGASIEQILPPIYNSVALIIGLGFLILICGFALLYRRQFPAAGSKSTAGKGGR